MPLARNMRPRDPSEHHRAATPLELFFDLVTVIAVAALTAAFHHSISAGHGWQALPNFVFLFIAIWWAWMNYTWFASAFDNGGLVFKLLTGVIMTGYLVFAAGQEHIFATLDFSYGLAGWIVMRIGMVALWLLAAAGSPLHRQTALRYAAGIFVAQVCWILLYLLTPAGSTLFFIFGIVIWLIEFSVPALAERVSATPFHHGHIVERYGLLNIIVLGEVLLSVALFFGAMFDGHFDWDLVFGGLSGVVVTFALWWIYFAEEEPLDSNHLPRLLQWGYGHVVVFLGGSLLAAGIGANLDYLTHHSELGAGGAAATANIAVALYLAGLWLVRDIDGPFGWRKHLTLVGAVGMAGAAWFGLPLWGTALAMVVLTALRVRPEGGALTITEAVE